MIQAAPMKPVILVGLLVLAATQANAGSWLKQERPCGARCSAPKSNTLVQSPFIHQNLGDANMGELVYQSRTRSVYSSSLGGTSVYNSTYRVYRQSQD
jgi:hypothetical protein